LSNTSRGKQKKLETIVKEILERLSFLEDIIINSDEDYLYIIYDVKLHDYMSGTCIAELASYLKKKKKFFWIVAEETEDKPILCVEVAKKHYR